MQLQPHPTDKNSQPDTLGDRVTTALMLAAGKGTRLRPVSDNIPKCLVDVGGKPLLQRVIDALERHGFRRLVIVTGYRSELIEDFLKQCGTRLNVRTIHNAQYDSTNNIHSLWLAGQAVNEPFLLVESDLVFEPDALAKMTLPDRIALARFDPEIHHGTTARATPCGHLESLHMKGRAPAASGHFKTVNICSFSMDSWNKLYPVLQAYVDSGRTDIFYERAICDLIESGKIRLRVADFSDHWWDEIDSGDDLLRVRRQIKERATT
jgi:L-glutamine-phosphate cytidylyltransferase